ncbi:MAG: OmpA family protein [Patescibacteria group bacterium]
MLAANKHGGKHQIFFREEKMKRLKWILFVFIAGIFFASGCAHQRELPLLPELAQQKNTASRPVETAVTAATEESAQPQPVTITSADLKEFSESSAAVEQPAQIATQRPVSNIETRLSAVEKTVGDHTALLSAHGKAITNQGYRISALESYVVKLDQRLTGMKLDKGDSIRVGTFEKGSAALSPKMKGQIKSGLNKLNNDAKAAGKTTSLGFEGYASEPGDPAKNQELSQKRAIAVAEYATSLDFKNLLVLEVAGKGIGDHIVEKNNRTAKITVL